MRRAAIVCPVRTAVGSYGGTLKPFGAEKLGGHIIKALLERSGMDPARTSRFPACNWIAAAAADCRRC